MQNQQDKPDENLNGSSNDHAMYNLFQGYRIYKSKLPIFSKGVYYNAQKEGTSNKGEKEDLNSRNGISHNTPPRRKS
jgi:hypothetical protein